MTDKNYINTNNYENVSNSKLESLKSNDKELCNDLYPERRGQCHKPWIQNFFGLENKTKRAKVRCEINVNWCLKNSPLVKIMLAALQVSGCEFNFERHISCETCDATVSGGFDVDINQVIICQNVAVTRNTVQAVLVHEMTHMFDYCQNNLDFQNIHHIACSEIRAANLANCSFLSAWFYGNVSLFNIKGSHKIHTRRKILKNKCLMLYILKRIVLFVLDRLEKDKCWKDGCPNEDGLKYCKERQIVLRRKTDNQKNQEKWIVEGRKDLLGMR